MIEIIKSISGISTICIIIGFIFLLVAILSSIQTQWFTFALSRLQQTLLAIIGIVALGLGIFALILSPGPGVPAGTIAAHLAVTDPDGWLICNGKPIDKKHSELIRIVGVNTPDLRGYFLRGYDPEGNVDPNGPQRALGKPQLDSTRMPDKHFVITGDGIHDHKIDGHFNIKTNGNFRRNGGSYDNIEVDEISTNKDGVHDHIINGGDGETRPKNVAVNYIIKY